VLGKKMQVEFGRISEIFEMIDDDLRESAARNGCKSILTLELQATQLVLGIDKP